MVSGIYFLWSKDSSKKSSKFISAFFGNNEVKIARIGSYISSLIYDKLKF